MNVLKQARGHLFDGLAILCGILAYLQTAGITQFLPEQYAWAPIALGAVNIGLHGLLSMYDSGGDHDDRHGV